MYKYLRKNIKYQFPSQLDRISKSKKYKNRNRLQTKSSLSQKHALIAEKNNINECVPSPYRLKYQNHNQYYSVNKPE